MISSEIQTLDKDLFFKFMIISAEHYKKKDPDPKISNMFFETYTSNPILIDASPTEKIELEDYIVVLKKERERPLENPYRI